MKHLASLVLLSVTLQAAAQDKGLTFYLPFDRDATAAKSGGAAEPLPDSRTGSLVPGLKGSAMQFSRGNALVFPTKGNYDNARGSLEMWLRYDELVDGASSAVFTEGRGSAKTQLRIFYHYGWSCFFISHNALIYSKVALPLREKRLGSWAHLVVCWDKDIGTRFYLDGEFVAHTGHSACKEPVLNYKRESHTAETFTFGPKSDKVTVTIDEVKVYDRMLTKQEVRRKFLDIMPVTVTLRNHLITQERPQLELRLRGRTDKTVTGTVSFGVIPWASTRLTVGNVTYGKPQPVTVSPNDTTTEQLAPALPTPHGSFCLSVKGDFGGYTATRNLFFASLQRTPEPAESEMHPELELEVLQEFDCTKTYGPETFCDDGQSRVVDSPLGRYRITAPNTKWSRFAYRFLVTHTGKLHMAEVVWPDDHEFEMEIMLDSAYGGVFQVAENGVIAGGQFPNSNTLKTYRLLFYPPHRECTIMFMNWPLDGPAPEGRERWGTAAVKSVKIYRVSEGLPATQLANLPPEPRRRRVGVLDEDCSTYREFSGYALGEGLDKWYSLLQRRFDYMQYTGQNLFGHTVMHYGGTLFPGSPVSSYMAKALIFPDYWVDLALYTASQRGIKFTAGVCYLHNSELADMAAATPHDEMTQGKETPMNVAWNGEYYPQNYGTAPPALNILHPDVQEHVLGFFADFMDRYGHYDALDGIDLWFWRNACLWLGGLKAGYSDFNIDLFEKDSGIDVPGEAPDRRRFVDRYVFLTKKDTTVREQWIDWRCRKVHEFWKKVYTLIQSKRPGTRLTFQTWAVLPNFRYEIGFSVWKRGDVESIERFYREGGFDLDLYKDTPHLYLGNVFYHNIRLDSPRSMARDFEFADARRLPFRNKGLCGVWLEQDRREFDNFHRATAMPGYWLPQGIGHPHPREDGDHKRPNNTYGGHLEKSGAVMPNSDFYLEYYANCLADWDLREIVDGGITTTTLGVENKLRDFIRAYLTLPTEHFEIFKNVSDPVCVRTWKDRFYLVNREFYPIDVSLSFSRDQVALHDLAADTRKETGNPTTVSIAPFRVLSYRLPAGVTLTAVEVHMPEARLEWLKTKLARLKLAIEEAEKGGRIIPRVANDLPWFKQALDTAWTQKRYSHLRHLLNSYWARGILNLNRYQAYLRFFDYKYHERFLAQTPTVTASQVRNVPPLESPEWSAAAVVDDMADLSSWEGGTIMAPSAVKTALRCVYNDKEIGFLVSCPVQDTEKLVPAESWRDVEIVELFLSTNKDGKPYYHYKTCYQGPTHEKRCRTEFYKSEPPKYYTPQYTIETGRTANGWQARWVIPFESLDHVAPPKKGDVWRLNYGRRLWRKDLGWTWQGMRSRMEKNGLHCPDLFAKLVFD